MAQNTFESLLSGSPNLWDGSVNANNWGGGTFGTNKSHNIDLIYQNLLGRNADTGGKDYWDKQLSSGAATYKTLIDSIKATNEFGDQQTYAAANPNWTADDLKSLSSAHVSPYHSGSGSAVAGWKPGDPLTMDIAKSTATTVSNADGSQKLDSDGNPIQKNSYDDQTAFTVADIAAANAANNTTFAEIGGTGDGTVNTTVNNSTTTTTPTGLTQADLNAWGNALDKPWLNTTNTNTTNTTNSSDDFMKLMMFMAMMRPQGGGYGGSQYGYGGLNPGGVQSAYNPMSNLSSYMNAFKTLPGISTNTISTGTN